MEKQQSPIERACGIVKSQAELARILEISASMVNQWVGGARPVPIEYCLAIEQATKGAVTRKCLRPDDWGRIWPDIAKQPRKQRAAAQGVSNV